MSSDLEPFNDPSDHCIEMVEELCAKHSRNGCEGCPNFDEEGMDNAEYEEQLMRND